MKQNALLCYFSCFIDHLFLVFGFCQLPSCGLHDLYVEFPSKRFLVDSSASAVHTYFVLRVSEVLQVSLYFLPLILQGIHSLLLSSELQTFSAHFEQFP